MDSAPAELLVAIFELCDFSDLLAIRQVNSRLCFIVEDILRRKRALSISDLGRRCFNFAQAAQFTKLYLYGLNELELNGACTTLTFANMFLLSTATPQLKSLKILQRNGFPVVDSHCLYSLSHFPRLTALEIEGWRTLPNVGRGNIHINDPLPIRALEKIEALSVTCRHDTVDTFLKSAHDANLENLRHVKLCVHSSHASERLLRLLSRNKQIETIDITGFLFPTAQVVENFYRLLQNLPLLKEISIANCSSVAALDSAVINNFMNQLRMSGKQMTGSVSSLRFAPNM